MCRRVRPGPQSNRYRPNSTRPNPTKLDQTRLKSQPAPGVGKSIPVQFSIFGFLPVKPGLLRIKFRSTAEYSGMVRINFPKTELFRTIRDQPGPFRTKT